MTNSHGEETPQSPETQDENVRKELDQEGVSHEGEKRATPAHANSAHSSQHMGAVEGEQTPVTTPMSGPADLVGENDVSGQGNESGSTEIGEELFDPRDELTPG